MRTPASLLLAIVFFVAAQTALAQKKLTIIGSSTSFCVGPTVNDSCYVSRLRAYFNKQAPNDTTINNDLAIAGSALYRGMPSTYIPPYADPLLQPDPLHNITAALATHPDVILINYPTNGYDSLPLSNVLFCFRTIRDVANQAGVPCFITTTQPRTSYPFVTSATKRRLADLKDSILLQFGSFAIDFYTGLFNPADSSIRYDAGDGTHMNNTGHDSLYQRVLRKNVFSATVLPVPACAANTAPANATIIATQTTATLTWNAPATATLYDIYIWTGATPPVTPAASNIATTTFNATGLTASTVYNWYVVPKNASGPATGCSTTAKTTFTTASASGTPGTGLQGAYFNNITLTGTPVVTRTDPAINFEYIYTQSAPGVNLENYSVRWTGQVKPLYSETYTFYAVTDDGVRLWVNGVQLVNNWVNQGATEKSGTITLVAGQKYDIVMEYYQGTGYASAKLYWSGASTPKAIIPAAQLFPPGFVDPTVPNCTINIAPVNAATLATTNTATLNWTAAANATLYDVYLWTGATAPATPTAADVVGTTYSATALIASTTYNWYVVPKNTTGSAAGCAISNKTSFTTAAVVTGPGTGLQGDYFNNIALTGTPVVIRIDPTINFDYIYTQSAPGINLENYSVRWTGQVKPLYSETYTFYAVTDDGVRLWVNGVQLVNNWVNQGATEKSGTITLAAGQKYDIVMEYYQGTGYASSKLYWSGASTPKAIIPAAQLFPPGFVDPTVPNCTINITPVNAATLATSTTATLNWTAAANATSYDVYLWTGATAPVTPTANVSTTTYNAAGLTIAALYNWYVVPRNATGTATGCSTTAKTTFTTASASGTPGTGLQGDYFNNITLTGTPVVTRIDPTVNFDYIYTQSAPGVNLENYSVRWTGQVKPLYSETYTFYVNTDDGVRLWVNGVQLVNNWVNQGATEKSGTIVLVGGQRYDIIMEYYQGTGYASSRLSWSSASTPKAIIPASQLYPPGAGARVIDPGMLQLKVPIPVTSSTSSLPVITARISPNPVKPGQSAWIQLTSNKAGPVVMTAVNSYGQIIGTQEIKLLAGVNTRVINAPLSGQGFYLIHITGSDRPLTMKLLVQ